MENDQCIVRNVCKNIGNDFVKYKTYPKMKDSGVKVKKLLKKLLESHQSSISSQLLVNLMYKISFIS